MFDVAALQKTLKKHKNINVQKGCGHTKGSLSAREERLISTISYSNIMRNAYPRAKNIENVATTNDKVVRTGAVKTGQ